MESHYLALLRDLSMRKGLLGQIFAKAQNKIQDPAKLSRLVAMIDETKWTRLGVDVKGDIYEGILEKKCRRYQIRRGAILYAARFDSGNCRMRPPAGRYPDCRPGSRHRRLFIGGIQLFGKTRQSKHRPKRAVKKGTFFGQ